MHPLMIVVILLTPPLLMARSLQHLNLSLLGIVGLGPPLVYSVSQQALYIDWKKRAVLVDADAVHDRHGHRLDEFARGASRLPQPARRVSAHAEVRAKTAAATATRCT